MPLKLKITTWDRTTGNHAHHASDSDVALTLERSALEDQIWPTVATVDINDGDKYCRFFVSVHLKNGRPICQVSHNRKTGSMQAVRKDITGSFWIPKT